MKGIQHEERIAAVRAALSLRPGEARLSSPKYPSGTTLRKPRIFPHDGEVSVGESACVARGMVWQGERSSREAALSELPQRDGPKNS
jgi:hypothetical protein